MPRRVSLADDSVDLGFGGLDAQDDLVALDLLEGEDLVQLALELVDEALFVFVGPGRLRRGREGVLELLVLDVLPLPVGAFGGRELDAEPERLAFCLGNPRRLGTETQHLPISTSDRPSTYLIAAWRTAKTAYWTERGDCPSLHTGKIAGQDENYSATVSQKLAGGAEVETRAWTPLWPAKQSKAQRLAAPFGLVQPNHDGDTRMTSGVLAPISQRRVQHLFPASKSSTAATVEAHSMRLEPCTSSMHGSHCPANHISQPHHVLLNP
jgi:hypothetical protein